MWTHICKKPSSLTDSGLEWFWWLSFPPHIWRSVVCLLVAIAPPSVPQVADFRCQSYSWEGVVWECVLGSCHWFQVIPDNEDGISKWVQGLLSLLMWQNGSSFTWLTHIHLLSQSDALCSREHWCVINWELLHMIRKIWPHGVLTIVSAHWEFETAHQKANMFYYSGFLNVMLTHIQLGMFHAPLCFTGNCERSKPEATGVEPSFHGKALFNAKCFAVKRLIQGPLQI